MAAINWVGQTNQRLYQCRLLQEQICAGQEPALQQALDDAALLQLFAAYRCYLNELALAAGVTNRVDSLTQLLQQTALVTGDMRQWQALSADTFSWFCRFLQVVEQLGWPDTQAVDSSLATEVSGLIASSASSDEDDSVSHWLASFHRLIDEQRANQRES
ncbi:DUF6586 family protein [Candidatus Thalassolituus haligoni]|jgi:hypothetical protein|uniref:DUF6586 family protein n=1 Tax=Candidatus Thalassolituus haligoni TaxID=3100113 RepID=UPI003514F954|tara:strand:- start:1661 stop:2140 length:480 start_codon:yes stop_codon:yes gene_type:complete